jgi:hypothetical protein
MSHTRSDFKHTPLWAAVASTLAELQSTGEVKIETGAEYVIDFLCRELVAKRVVTDAAAALGSGR